jgi:hypothetical protein
MATNSHSSRGIVRRVVFSATRVASKESRGLVLPRISCFMYTRHVKTCECLSTENILYKKAIPLKGLGGL